MSSVQKLKIDTMVADERKIFVTVKEDLEQCIDGILKATVILLKKKILRSVFRSAARCS